MFGSGAPRQARHVNIDLVASHEPTLQKGGKLKFQLKCQFEIYLLLLYPDNPVESQDEVLLLGNQPVRGQLQRALTYRLYNTSFFLLPLKSCILSFDQPTT